MSQIDESESQSERDEFDRAFEEATSGAPADLPAAATEPPAEDAPIAQDQPAESGPADQAPGAEQGQEAEEVETVRLSKAELEAMRSEAAKAKATAESMLGRLQATQRELAEFRNRQQARAAQQEPEPAEPNVDDYDTTDAYLDALEQHEAAMASRQGQPPVQGAPQGRPAPEYAPSAEEQAIFNEQRRNEESRRQGLMAQASAKYPDFVPVVTAGTVPITQAMAEALYALSEEDFAEAAYYLGKHPEEAMRLAGSGHLQQVVGVGALAERLRSGRDAKKQEVDRAAAAAAAVPTRQQARPPAAGLPDKNDFDGAWELATRGSPRR